MVRRLWLAALVLLAPASALAGSQAEAKMTAIENNCAPGKIEVARHLAGRNGETVYKINCTDVKGQFVLVQCRLRQCQLMR
ncbi:MAG TPA: hypothetical protein VEB64_11845 [Azospirillaceae bacterium]|nr:hypothetical protein [Azospirillaceae bacterium]